MSESSASNTSQLLLTVEEAAQRLRICRSNMYKLIGSGAIQSVQIGRLRRVAPSALEDYVQRLTTQNRKVA